MAKLALILIFIALFSLTFVSSFNFPSDSTTVTTFTGNLTNWRNLSDTPSSFSGQTLKFVRVNVGETALEFATASSTDATWVANWTAYNATWSAGAGASDATWVINWSAYNTTWSSITNESYVKIVGDTMTGDLNVSASFHANQYQTDDNQLQFNFYDDGTDIIMNISNGGGDFFIEQENSKLGLFNEPSAGNDFKVLQVFSKQAGDVTEFVVTKAGVAHTSYFARSLALVGNGTLVPTPFNCSTYAAIIDCSTDVTGPDFFVLDDIETWGSVYFAKGNFNVTDEGNISSAGNVSANYYFGNGSQLTDITLVETDPFWSLNYSTFLTHATTTYVDTQNSSQTNYLVENNVSVNNWINENNVSVTNAIADIGSYDDAWINGTIDLKILTNNNSVNNYMTFLNSSQTNYIVENNGSVNNYIVDTNSSQTNYILENNNSVNNWIDENNVSITNAIADISAYDDSWINGTIDLKDIAINDSMKNYVDDTFLTSYANSGNTTQEIWDVVNNGTFATIVIATAQNTSQTNYINENNESVTNAIADIGAYDDAWINGTVDLKDVAINDSMKNYVDDTFLTSFTELDPKWSANYSTFLENNNSLTNYIAENNASVNNYILEVNATNGDGGGTSDATWVANWTAYNSTDWTTTIQEIWDIVGNGTVFLTINWNSTNTTYDENNDSVTNYVGENNASVNNWIDENNVSVTNAIADIGAYDDAWINGTIDLKDIAINDSMKNYVDDTFLTSYANTGNTTQEIWDVVSNGTLTTIIVVTAQNTSQTNYIVENNDSVTNAIADIGAYDDAWINGTIDVKDLVINNTLVNWIAENNASVVNWATDTFLTSFTELDPEWSANYSTFLENNNSLTNYIAENNASVTNAIAGHTVAASRVTTGSFGAGNYVMDTNLTAERFVFETDGGHRIEDNSTCILMYGDTSVFELC